MAKTEPLKERIRALLESNRQEALSGQGLADRFGVSRSAVWKAVNALRQAGYEIASTTHNGYQMAADCDMLSKARLCAGLPPSLPVTVLEQVDSTNNEAKRLLAQGTAPPFLVAAEAQTNGRGRNGQPFYSPKGAGLYFSLVLCPALPLLDSMGITSYAAVCAAEAIEAETGVSAEIKWVNDLYLQGKKICGILTEAVTDFESQSVAAVIVGIGLNLRPAQLPKPVAEIAGALNPKQPVKNQLLCGMVNRLLRYPAEKEEKMAAYRSRSLVLGRQLRYPADGKEEKALAVAVDAAGGLVLRRSDGTEITLRSGSVFLEKDE